MEVSPTIHQEREGSSANQTLQVEFGWMKWKALITEKNDPQAKPIYIVDFKFFKPNLVFTSSADDSKIGSGTVHAISIDADCEIRGQPTKLKALKRFKTQYTHQSYAFSNTDAPVSMTWTTTCDLKRWNFICLDPQQNPVAQFSANIWAVRRVGSFDFLGSEATISDAARDEIVVTGMTLFYCMLLRCNNLLNFFGAIFARTGSVEKDLTTDAAQDADVGESVKDSQKTKVH